jgi:TonB family protein
MENNFKDLPDFDAPQAVDGSNDHARNSPNVSSAKDETNTFWARLFLGISLSILLHLFTSIATWQWAQLASQESRIPQRVLIEWIEPSRVDVKSWTDPKVQIVRKTDLPPEALLPEREDVRRRFLSESRQTVKDETQAARSGMTENRGGRESNPQSHSQNQPLGPAADRRTARHSHSNKDSTAEDRAAKHGRDPRRKLPELDTLAGGISVPRFSRENFKSPSDEKKESTRELLLPADPRRLSGVSTSGERLPEDIRIGNFTALNTDRFVYYTFYARIEEQIRHRWVRYVKAAIYGGGDVAPGRREFLTNLEIVLNRQGEFVRALIHQSSGSKDLDAAPVLAFREARLIPNPPREMIKPDGTIRLLYSFSVDNLPPTNQLSSAKEDRSELE